VSLRPTTPTPEEVDSLAAFIEAVEELEREPFFGPDDNLKIVSRGGMTRYEFGDRFHFRSALVSFRRHFFHPDAWRAGVFDVDFRNRQALRRIAGGFLSEFSQILQLTKPEQKSVYLI
jgi:hypothetical protein